MLLLSFIRDWPQSFLSLAWPDPFRAAAYRLEIISAALQRSGIVHVFKKIYNSNR